MSAQHFPLSPTLDQIMQCIGSTFSALSRFHVRKKKWIKKFDDFSCRLFFFLSCFISPEIIGDFKVIFIQLPLARLSFRLSHQIIHVVVFDVNLFVGRIVGLTHPTYFESKILGENLIYWTWELFTVSGIVMRQRSKSEMARLTTKTTSELPRVPKMMRTQ